MKVYIVVELTKETPKILSVNKTKREAEKVAYNDKTKFCNIIEKELGA